MQERSKSVEWVEDQTKKILKERTPSPDQVIYDPTIEFLDLQGELTREERGKVIAMGDRTAIAYKELSRRVVEERNKPPVELEGEMVDATAAFYLQYALAARSQNEIAHSSILEQMNVGPGERGGDPPIILEGISVLAGLRDVCAQRHFGFEVFSSRGGVFPEGYWRIDQNLVDAGIGGDLEAINREVYAIYLKLTEAGIRHYLQTLPRRDAEKDWQFRWRVLNCALDDSRQVTNQTFISHFSMHPNSALSMREGLVKLSSSELPETVEIADRLRELTKQGLPTLMRFTDASPYHQSLPEKKRALVKKLGLKLASGGLEGVARATSLNRDGHNKPEVLTTPGDNINRVFLAAFLANGGELSPREVEGINNLSDPQIEEAIDDIFEGLGFHDKPPQELETINIFADLTLSIGAIYELARHRPATHLVANFSPYYGFTMPQVYEKLGLAKEYREAIMLNNKGYNKIASLGSKWERVFGPYMTARAHLQPYAIRMSALDAFHILKLRTDPAAHPDLSSPMLQLEQELRGMQPTIFNHLVKRR